jgi:hypothetical protein
VFVIETTVYDGVYDPTQTDYGDGTNGADPCTGPCAESDGVPYFVNNVAQIAQGITMKNAGVANSTHVTFSLVDHFSNYNSKDSSTDSHDDDDGSEYNVDVSTFEPATTFANTVTAMATKNPSPLFGGGCSSSGWSYNKHFYCDSDFSDNFLQGSMITAIYGGLHGSGLGWANNSTTYHVIVWMGSTLPRDPSYPGDWCATYNDEAKACPDVASSSEPTYTYASGTTEPAGETIASLATIANQEHVIIDTIDLPNGLTEVTPPAPKVTGDTDYLKSTTAEQTAAKEDVTSILSAGCNLAKDTGGSWEGPSPSSSGVSFTCSAAATGTTDGNLTDTWCAYTTTAGCWPAWSADPSLGWALTNIKFPVLTRDYNITAALGEHAFTYIPELGFATDTSGMTYSCRHNGTDISQKCANALNGTVGPGHGWDWPLPAMYPGDYWSVSFTVTVSNFPTYLLNNSIPIDLCVNNTPQWSDCTGSGSGQFTYVAYTNYTGGSVVQSFPAALVDVVTSSTSVPTLTSVSVVPTISDILPGGSATFTASPVCTWGTCPAGTLYSWVITNKALGTLTSGTGNSATFTALSTLGNDTVFVNGTLYGITQQSLPTTISIENLVSVAVTPPSAGILINASKSFSATPTCTFGTCPAGTSYYWNLTNYAMGSLVMTGATVAFTAMNITGTVNLIANATLGGITVMSPIVPITISKTLPPLATVSITPSTASIAASSTGIFSTSITCGTSTSVPCPSGATYSWNLTSDHFGYLNTTVQPTVLFTAGGVGGVVNLFVNASLNNKTVQSLAAVITILPPTLLTVKVSPASLALYANGVQNFSTNLGCKGGPCPVGTTYTWALTSTSLGNLNSTSGPDVMFTAGIVSGQVGLFVNATLSGTTVEGGPSLITVSGLPTLSGVTVSPAAVSITAGGTKSLTATPVCAGGTCPSGTSFAWSTTSALGTLNSYGTASVVFTADRAGVMALFVNASLNGLTASSSPVIITISGPLKSITVTPATASIPVQGVADFKASIACSTSTCPAGTQYSWSMTNTLLGKLNSTSSFMVAFTAGTTAGALNLYVNATLDGATVHSAAVPVTIMTVQTIVSVKVSPTSESLTYGQSLAFKANVTCTSGACPGSLKFSWTMDNPLGTLSSNNSGSTTFTAGNSAGITNLTVTATLNGHSMTASAQISISPTPSTPPVSGFHNTTMLIMIVGLVAAAAVIIAIFAVRSKRKKEEVPAETESPYGFVMNSQAGGMKPVSPPPKR